MSSTGSQSWDELRWLDLKIGHHNSSPSNEHQGYIPHWLELAVWWHMSQCLCMSTHDTENVQLEFQGLEVLL